MNHSHPYHHKVTSSHPWCSKYWLRDPILPAGKFFHGLCLAIGLIGVVANILTIFVMRRPKLRVQTTSIFLIALAIFDTFKLITAIIMIAENSILPTWNTNTFFTTNPSCAAFMFIQKFMTCSAIWLVCSVTIERFVIVYFPLHAKRIISHGNAKKFVGIVLVINFFVNLDYAITSKYNEKRQKCSSRDFYKEYCEYRTMFKGIAECLWKLIPLLLNVIFNSLIIAKVFKTPKRMNSRRRDSIKRHGSKIDTSQLLRMLLTVSIVSTLILIPPNINSAHGKFTSKKSCIKTEVLYDSSNNRTNSINSTNDMTHTKDGEKAALNNTIIEVFNNATNDATNDSFNLEEESMSAGECAISIMKTYFAGRPFFILNHAVNFFLYIISGTTFRREFIKMLQEWRKGIIDSCCKCSSTDGADTFDTQTRRKKSWISSVSSRLSRSLSTQTSTA